MGQSPGRAVVPQMLLGHFRGSEEQYLREFIAWRDEVDEEYLLDTFDMALAWFAAKGFDHDRCCHLAQKLNDWILSGIHEMEGIDEPARVIFE